MITVTLKPDLQFLTISELIERVSRLDSLKEQVSRRLAKLQEEIKRVQSNLISPFRNDPFLRDQISQRFRDGKVTLESKGFIEQAMVDLDASFKAAGVLINEVLDQKPFYDSPVKIATRMIGDTKRLNYLQDLEHVGALALANLAQLAVSTKNKALGSAIVERLAVMPTEKKPVRATEVAKVVFADEWNKSQEAFTMAENRFREITVLYRAFKQQRVQPLQSVQLALDRQKETGVLDELIQEERGNRHV